MEWTKFFPEGTAVVAILLLVKWFFQNQKALQKDQQELIAHLNKAHGETLDHFHRELRVGRAAFSETLTKITTLHSKDLNIAREAFSKELKELIADYRGGQKDINDKLNLIIMESNRIGSETIIALKSFETVLKELKRIG